VAALALVGGAAAIYVFYPTEPTGPTVTKAPEATESAASENQARLPKAPVTVPSFASPTFDVVRINREGNAVIAGRAPPGSEVTVYAGDEVVGTVQAGGRGEWVLVPEMPLEGGSQNLSLRALGPQGETANSDDVVVVMIPKHKPSGESGAAKSRESRAAKETETGPQLQPQLQPQPQPQQVVVVAIPRDTFGASRVLQGPTISPDVLSGTAVQLSAVNYDERGRLVLAGFAPPRSMVRIKVDGRSAGTTIADDVGYWELTPANTVAFGDHTLTVESVDDAGAVVASTQLPFTRAEITQARLRPGELLVAVQPGNSLWRIARATYGEGVMYTVIYSANAEKIRNPDLIFPGQVFTLPAQN